MSLQVGRTKKTIPTSLLPISTTILKREPALKLNSVVAGTLVRSGMRAEDLIVTGPSARSASQVPCSSFQEGHVDSGSSTGRLGLARLISLPSCSRAGGFSDRPCSAVFHDPLVEVDGSAGRLGSARLISQPSCPRSRTSGSVRQGTMCCARRS